ncbi:MAG: cysteine desulfurase [Bacteroidia bacterium]|nr:cysteine desulfurase [Bacteroidia bacterium]
MNSIAYFDHNASTPVHARVLEKMLPFFSVHFGNASSGTHAYGLHAERAVKQARETIAASIGCSSQEIIFTSGSTEAINLGIRGVYEAYASKGREIVTVGSEHKAVLDTCRYLGEKGAKITRLGVDRSGRINPDELEQAVSDKTLLVCIMLANNETGVIQDLKKIAEIVHSKGSILMSDTTQAWGKIPVDIHELGIDICCMSGHKIYGPKGVGMIYARRKNPRVTLSPLIFGGGHERGLRSGTLNVPGIVGLGAAVERLPEMLQHAAVYEKWRDRMEKELIASGKGSVNASGVRLPNTSNLVYAPEKASRLIVKLPEFAFSSGSACTSANPEPSHVLQAMGVPDEEIQHSVRISFGELNTEEQVSSFISALVK